MNEQFNKNIFFTCAILLGVSIILFAWKSGDTTQTHDKPENVTQNYQDESLGPSETAPLAWVPISATSTEVGYLIKDSLIYFYGNISSPDGHLQNILINTEPRNFLISEQNIFWGKDDKNVFFAGKQVPGADAKSFITLSNKQNYAKDHRQVYYGENSSNYNAPIIIAGADPTTFSVLEHGYAKDKNNVYLPKRCCSSGVSLLQNADPATFDFLVLNMKLGSDADSEYYGFYAKDKNNVFFGDRLISSSASTFDFIRNEKGEFTGYAKDKDFIYNQYTGEIIKNADPKTFVALNEVYAKDKNTVYSYNPDVFADSIFSIGTVVDGADASTFEIIAGKKFHDAKDKNHYFLEGRITR